MLATSDNLLQAKSRGASCGPPRTMSSIVTGTPVLKPFQSVETDLLQPFFVQAEEVPGLVQQGDADLVAQIIVVGRHPLQVPPEQHDLRHPRPVGRTARLAVGRAVEQPQPPRG